MKHFLLAAALCLPAWSACSADAPADAKAAAKRPPNIVVILADDLGYGDVHALNPARGKIPTPRMDQLAAQGMAFTDAHASSSVCTPSRYALLTGRYNWRSPFQKKVLPHYGKPIIADARLTLPEMLKAQGYATACFGKWHLGWDWPMADGKPDFSKPIGGGPTAHGFDRYFGVDVPNYPPYCFIEGDRTVGIPSVPLPEKNFKGHLASNRGLSVPGWDLEAVLPTLTDKTCAYIEEKSKEDKPYFLFYAMTGPHTPLVPSKKWQGKTGLGDYADFVCEVDEHIGRVLAAVEKSGQADHTVVILSSDNGCAHYIGVPAMEGKGHFPSAQFRGYKSDNWDGGHRIPLIVRWPGQVKPGATCAQMACLSDLMATCADISGAKIPANAGEDSVSLMPLLKGGHQPVRDLLVHHSLNGKFALREGQWKIIFSAGSGGWNAPTDAQAYKNKQPTVQLYDLENDPGEKHNLQAKHPARVARMTAKLKKLVEEGRSTPGARQKNDVPVEGLPDAR